ncbi:MAG: alpha/beta hydrolase, partial [Pseudomonadota bacterium]
TVTASVRDDRRSLAEGITVPVLALAGSQDRLTPPETAMEIARRIPNCELAIIDGAGHVSNMERPETFNRVVRSFLRRAEATHREGAAA